MIGRWWRARPRSAPVPSLPVPTSAGPLSDADLIRQSGLFDAAWYVARYPDAVRTERDALHHFLTLGLMLGRDPGPHFDSRAYLAAYPDVAQSGQAALLHYLRSGRAEGRRAQPPAVAPLPAGALAQVAQLRRLLETGGLEQGPLTALAALAQAGDTAPDAAAAAQAAEVLGLWALHRGQAQQARDWFARRLQIGAGAATVARLAPLQLIAACQASNRAEAQRILESLPSGAEPGAELSLAATWLDDTPEARLARINAALPEHAPIRLCSNATAAFDRLEARAAPIGTAQDAPLVSVLMAAHNAAATIETALRAVTAQSWQALELLVIDDASTDDTAARVARAAARDPRIRLIRLAQNRGAYGARNAGLAAARGRYVTLHDADDWSHPHRLAQQVQAFADTPGIAGCMTRQIRCTDDLRVSRWTGTGAIVHENLSSLMLPTDLMHSCLGGWDRVRVSADSELLRRVQTLFGATSVPVLPGGPLTLQRDGAGNATADSATGMGWFYYGARQEYHEAQLAHHRSATTLRYDPNGPRPFPAPAILQPAFDRATVQTFEHVYAGVLSVAGDRLAALLDWLDEDRAAGRRAALVPLYDIDAPWGGDLAVHPALRARIDGQSLSLLCHGEEAHCQRFRLLPGQRPPAPHRYLPRIHEGAELVLAPAAPAPKVNDR